MVRPFSFILLVLHPWSPNEYVLHQILVTNKLECSSDKLKTLRHVCQLGKSCRLCLPIMNTVSSTALDLIFSDVYMGSLPDPI